MKGIPLTTTILILTSFLYACSNGDNGGHAPAAATVPPPVVPPVSTPNAYSSVGNSWEINGEYQFTYNQCSTGKHKVNSKKEYCDALLNDSLNNNCARELRVQAYQQNCTGSQSSVNVGTLPAMTTARCMINGVDLKDRNFLESINPFNPQTRQIIRDLFWNGRIQKNYNVFSSVSNGYGQVMLQLYPAIDSNSAKGKIELRKQPGFDVFSVTTSLGANLRVDVTNFRTEKAINTSCITDVAFKRPKQDLRRVRCVGYFKDTRKEPVPVEHLLEWDTRSIFQKEIYRNRYNESVIIKLKPAEQGKEELIEIEGRDFGVDNNLAAQANVNEGIEVLYKGGKNQTDFAVTCSSASK